jgi:hypothetical protein
MPTLPTLIAHGRLHLYVFEPEPLIEATALRSLLAGYADDVIECVSVHRREAAHNFKHVGGLLQHVVAAVSAA